MPYFRERTAAFTWRAVLAGALSLAALSWTATCNYLLFHSLAELTSVAIAAAVFFIAWNARRFMNNNYLLFMGISYLFVGFLDVLHTLAYKGMEVFAMPHESNLATQLWIMARATESLALLAAPAFLHVRMPLGGVLAAFSGATLLALLAIFQLGVFPDCFVEGVGLTPFKITSEYAICAVLAVAGVLLWRNRQRFDPDVLFLLILSMLTTIASELCFTLYTHPYAFSNEIGHLLKVVSYFFMYRAIIVTGLQKPYALLFRDLSREVDQRKRAEASLQKAHDILEEQVALRTGELRETNQNLLAEIADRKRAEEERARANAELEEKNAELEEVLRVASHDLRSPLVNIDGYGKEMQYGIEALRKELAACPVGEDARGRLEAILEEDLCDSLRYIQTSTTKMDALLSGLLRVSRSDRHPLAIEVLDMDKLVPGMAQAMEYKIKTAGATLEIGSLPPCLGDAVQVGQVFLNLLDNAVKYLDPARPGVIRVEGYLEKGGAVYCVSDNGIGIAASHLDKIFIIFHRLDPKRGQGEGLGLTIVKRILSRLGGDIRVESELGSGSRFYVTLPAPPPEDKGR